MQRTPEEAVWPELPYLAWRETCTTLQLWTQIVGKIRLSQTPWLNYSWHVTLYVAPRGLTTSAIYYGTRSFQIDFDFIDHVLRIAAGDGLQSKIPLCAQSVADLVDSGRRLPCDLRAVAELPPPRSIACPIVPDPAPGVRHSRLLRHAAHRAEPRRKASAPEGTFSKRVTEKIWSKV